MTRDEKGRFIAEHYCKWHSEDDDCEDCGECIACGMCDCASDTAEGSDDEEVFHD